MANRTPREIVEQDHGGREKLIDTLLPLLEAEDKNETKRRLRGTSNMKLIKLLGSATEVRKRFQSKSALVAQIAEKKFAPGKPDPAYIEKISGFTVKRLLDLHRQVS